MILARGRVDNGPEDGLWLTGTDIKELSVTGALQQFPSLRPCKGVSRRFKCGFG